MITVYLITDRLGLAVGPPRISETRDPEAERTTFKVSMETYPVAREESGKPWRRFDPSAAPG